MKGGEATVRVATVTDRLGGLRRPPEWMSGWSVRTSRAARDPTGLASGILVHAVLATVDLAAMDEEVKSLGRGRGTHAGREP